MKRFLSTILTMIFLIQLNVVYAENSPFCTLSESEISADSFLLMEAETGTIIIEKNKTKKLPMASITKLMVLLIADEYIQSGKLKLTDIITGTPEAKETPGSRVYLDDGEKMTLDEILKSISIPSANDAAVALAQHISGSEAEFVKLMNEKAKKLGLKNTHYVTASGLDAPDHYSTAEDIAKLTLEILKKHPRIMEHAAMTEETLRGGSFPLINTNNLISTYKYATGLKTGTTENAGYCITATAEKDGVKLIAVVLGADSAVNRFADARTLFDYAYNNFAMITLQKKGILKIDDTEVSAAVERGNIPSLPAMSQKDIVAYIPGKYANKIKTEAILDEGLVAPITEGTKIGLIKIYADDILVGTYDALASKTVKKMNIFQSLFYIIRAWLSL